MNLDTTNLIQPEIILTVGLPRSGKTTWARQQGLPIVSPDSIRLALHGKRFEALAEDMVWSIVFIMIRSLIMAGNDKVIVDATHVSEKRRAVYRDKFPGYKISYKVFHSTKDECIRRALALNDQEIVPIIEKMAAECEPCTTTYLFDKPSPFDELLKNIPCEDVPITPGPFV